MGDEILMEVRDHVAHITLNRPDAGNSMNIPLCHEMLLAANRCDSDPNIRAVLLTGNGKMFSAGGDVKAFLGFGEQCSEKCKEMVNYLHGAISRLQRMNAPLVVAVNGHAAGAGLPLAASGDIVLAADHVKFTAAYTAIGLTPDGSSTWLLPRLIGKRKTAELMLTNRPVTADEAADIGLITRAVSSEKLLAEAEEIAQQLAQGATQALGAARRLIAQSFENSLETQMEFEARTITHAMTQAEFREGAAAFADKRKPDFIGI